MYRSWPSRATFLGRSFLQIAFRERPVAPPVSDAALRPVRRRSHYFVDTAAMIIIIAALGVVGAVALYETQSQRPVKADVVLLSASDAPVAAAVPTRVRSRTSTLVPLPRPRPVMLNPAVQFIAVPSEKRVEQQPGPPLKLH